MMPTAPFPVESARQRAARAEAVKCDWRAGAAPNAAAAFREHPELAADRAVAIELAYEEFCTREEAGERLDSIAFCARFSFGTSLRRLINVHRFLDFHPDALTTAPTSWPAPGETVADFLIVRELGRGGFSRVFLALEHSAGNRPVALKVSAANSREASTLGPLTHPHLTAVYSSRTVEPWNVVAMPFSGTATLEDALSAAWGAPATRPASAAVLLEAASRGGQPGDPEFPARPEFSLHASARFEDGLFTIARGLLSALVYLHAKGLAHRDLKPSNVLLAPTGHPYLLDFNLATGADDPWRLAGTLPYMAPEQLAMVADQKAAPPSDWRPCDVFAFGVMLHELLTGRHPYDMGETPAETSQKAAATRLLAAQSTGAPELPTYIPRQVRGALRNCLALNPLARPTAAQLVELFAQVTEPRPRRRTAQYALSIAILIVPVVSWTVSDRPAPATSRSTTQPTDPFDRGVWYAEQGDYNSARIEFQRVAVKNKDGRAHACAAYCLLRLKEHKLALVQADLAIGCGYRTAEMYANRAFANLQINQLDEAKDDCDSALRLDPHLRAAHLTRAAVAVKLHHRSGTLIPEALEDATVSAQAGPNTAETWMNTAQIFAMSATAKPELLDRALEAIRHAVQMGRTSETILKNPVLWSTLGQYAAFHEAVSTPRNGEAEPELNPRLIDIIPQRQ